MDGTLVFLASLRFEGERFTGHSLDVDCVSELQVYKQLVLACAKEIWWRNNPQRERLQRGFDERLTLRFSKLEDGSVVVPLNRVLLLDQSELDLGARDEFDEAAALIDAAICAANDDDLLPNEFPRNVIPLFREFGKTLRPDETLYLRSRSHSAEAPYSPRARQRLAEWNETTYEDLVNVTGEVSMANVRGGAFALLISPAQPPITGKFSEEQEAEILDALREHRTVRLRVRGLGEFSEVDRTLRRILRVDEAAVAPALPAEPGESDKPIWDSLSELGATAGDEVWSNVPTDLSQKIDKYVYGSEG